MAADRQAAGLPEPGPLPAQRNGYITFGCLNDFAKINNGVLSLWASVLRVIDESRLILLAPLGSVRQRTLDKFAAHGVQPDRVEFISRQPRAKYLAEFQRIDVSLDTLPYNGHTTSLDSIWMGVPVLTRVGSTVVGRAGFSQLSNLGLSDWVADDDEQFVGIASARSADILRLAVLRETLRDIMSSSPLMDRPRFARNMDTAYRRMWQTSCQAR